MERNCKENFFLPLTLPHTHTHTPCDCAVNDNYNKQRVYLAGCRKLSKHLNFSFPNIVYKMSRVTYRYTYTNIQIYTLKYSLLVVYPLTLWHKPIALLLCLPLFRSLYLCRHWLTVQQKPKITCYCSSLPLQSKRTKKNQQY